jgi:hypothetical protein
VRNSAGVHPKGVLFPYFHRWTPTVKRLATS